MHDTVSHIDFAKDLDHLDWALSHIPLGAPHRVAVDVGAHNGVYAAHLARDFVRVYAFEPAADMFEILSHRVATLHNVEVSRAALLDRSGFGSITEDEKRKGKTRARYVLPGVGNVPVTTLDAIVAEDFADVDFLKVDVEGAEELVLRGGEALLRRCRPVVMIERLKNLPLRHYGLSPDGAGCYLESLGASKVDTFDQDVVYAWR